jgi:preflagellin peptidase FlaK
LQQIIAAAQIILTITILLFASWKDYKTREVSNYLWVFYAPIAVSLSLAEFLLYDSAKLPLFGLSVGLTTVFALLLFYTGGFGGADSKALMCISLALPFFPEVLLVPVLSQGLSPLSLTVFPITILSNSVLIAAGSGVYLLLRNLFSRLTTGRSAFEGTLAKESLGKKILVLVTGKRYPIAVLKAKWHVYPLEDIAEKSEDYQMLRKLVVMPHDEGRDAIVQRLSKAVDDGKISDGIWATPGLPMLIFVTVGFILALILGDIVWSLISHLFG